MTSTIDSLDKITRLGNRMGLGIYVLESEKNKQILEKNAAEALENLKELYDKIGENFNQKQEKTCLQLKERMVELSAGIYLYEEKGDEERKKNHTYKDDVPERSRRQHGIDQERIAYFSKFLENSFNEKKHKAMK